MTTLELLVLLGSVAIVVIVWLIPLDRMDRAGAAGAVEVAGSEVPASASMSAGYAAPVAIRIPVSITGPGGASALPDPAPGHLTGLEVSSAAGLDPVGGLAAVGPALRGLSQGAATSTAPHVAISTSIGVPTLSSILVSAHESTASANHALKAAPLARSVDVVQSGYPRSIAVPVALSVASPPELVALAPVRPDAPFESSSATALSLTWSPHPAETERWAPSPQLWRGSQSAVARVLALDLRVPENPVQRRHLLLAASAGFAMALAVAGRR